MISMCIAAEIHSRVLSPTLLFSAVLRSVALSQSQLNSQKALDVMLLSSLKPQGKGSWMSLSDISGWDTVCCFRLQSSRGHLIFAAKQVEEACGKEQDQGFMESLNKVCRTRLWELLMKCVHLFTHLWMHVFSAYLAPCIALGAWKQLLCLTRLQEDLPQPIGLHVGHSRALTPPVQQCCDIKSVNKCYAISLGSRMSHICRQQRNSFLLNLPRLSTHSKASLFHWLRTDWNINNGSRPNCRSAWSETLKPPAGSGHST